MKSKTKYNLKQAGNIIGKGMPDLSDNLDLKRKVILIYFMGLVGIILLIFLGSIAAYHKNFGLLVIDFTSAIVLLLNLIYLKKTKKPHVAVFVGVVIASCLFLYLFISGGDQNTGHLWMLAFPLFSLFLLGTRNGVFITSLIFVFIIVYLFIKPDLPGFAVYSNNIALRLIGVFVFVSCFAYFFESTREGTYKELLEINTQLKNANLDLKKAELDLRKSGEKLELRVKERTHELSLANTQLKKEIEERKQAEDERHKIQKKLVQAQKMEAIGTLTGGVAHDLNNILAGIVGYPELILMKLPENSPLRKPIKTMQQSGEKAAAIVEDLLTLSRRNISVKEIILLEDIIKDYLQSPEYKKLMKYHTDVRIETFFGVSSAAMKGSPVHISKTIMNLVSNAAEAMPDGGDIIISTDVIKVDKKHPELQEGAYIKLQVADTGEGIAERDIKKNFEPFFSKKVMGRSGTGLGMAVVWGTVKDHDGTIEVKSHIGEGTVFTLYFPAISKNKQVNCEKPSGRAIDHLMGNGEFVLIVDDVEEQRTVSSSMLEILCYSVDSVSSGEEALEQLKSSNFDLILLDMIMEPGMDGLETLKKIKAIKPDQKAIITSGYSETAKISECIALTGGQFIKKPFKLEQIGSALKETLQPKNEVAISA